MKRETRLRPARGGSYFGAVAGLTPMAAPPPMPLCVCFVCKREVDNDRRFAICAECDDEQEIRSTWAIDYGEVEARDQENGERECFCPGWLWMNEDEDASFNIERCDTCAIYRNDREAATAMLARCNIRDVDWSA